MRRSPGLVVQFVLSSTRLIGFDPRMLSVEFAKTAAVHSASGLAPEVCGLVDVDGRRGVLFERVFGASMLDSMMSSEDKAVDHAVVFADLHREILGLSSGEDLPGVKEFMADKIDHADRGCPGSRRSWVAASGCFSLWHQAVARRSGSRGWSMVAALRAAASCGSCR